MSLHSAVLSDEQIAFLLQQEEYGTMEIQHIFLPPSTLSTATKPTQPQLKELKKPQVIVLDDSDDEIYDLAPKKSSSSQTPKHDEVGVLDVHELFVEYNAVYFGGKLGAVSVEWSPRMTLCAGLCSWNHAGDCRIKLSSKLLQYRSNKELKETLLHECIHAFLFVTHNNKDRDGHGPEFLKLMNHINTTGGFNISVYHTFHDEVNHFRMHWWQCDRCNYIIKRAMNRAPGPSDWWFPRHQRDCGGTYVKTRSPPEDEKSKKRKRDDSLGPNSEKDPNSNNALPRALSLGSAAPSPSTASPLPKPLSGSIMSWISQTPPPKPTQPK